MALRELKTYKGRVDLGQTNTSWTKIVNLIPAGVRVLEVGCAGGHVTGFLTREKDCRVIGVELNSEAAAAAEVYCDEMIVGDVEEGALDRVRGTFDVIVFADVLEHLRNPQGVLEESVHLLKEGGYLLISVPNVAHWDVRKDLLFGRFEYTESGLMDSTHIRFFTQESIRRLIEGAGFEIEISDATHRLPRCCKWGRCHKRSHELINRVFRGLFSYQFIFKARPRRLGDSGRHEMSENSLARRRSIQ